MHFYKSNLRVENQKCPDPLQYLGMNRQVIPEHEKTMVKMDKMAKKAVLVNVALLNDTHYS